MLGHGNVGSINGASWSTCDGCVVPIQMHATMMRQLPLITVHVYMFNSPVNPAKMV